MDRPGNSVVGRRNHRSCSIAILVGDVGRAVRANFDVSMQAAAIKQRIDWDGDAVSESAIHAQRARGVNNILRAVIDRVRITNSERNHGGSKWASANRLVINSRRNTAPHSRCVIRAVVITE
jgi:hypothetical protein